MITFIYSAQHFFLAKFSNGDYFFHPNVSHIIFWLTELQKEIFLKTKLSSGEKKITICELSTSITQKLKRKKKWASTGLSLSSQEMLQSYSPFSNEMS